MAEAEFQLGQSGPGEAEIGREPHRLASVFQCHIQALDRLVVIRFCNQSGYRLFIEDCSGWREFHSSDERPKRGSKVTRGAVRCRNLGQELFGSGDLANGELYLSEVNDFRAGSRLASCRIGLQRREQITRTIRCKRKSERLFFGIAKPEFNGIENGWIVEVPLDDIHRLKNR